MRRTGRHTFVKLSVFFLAYSIIHIVSVRSDNKHGNDPSDVTAASKTSDKTADETTESPLKKNRRLSKFNHTGLVHIGVHKDAQTFFTEEDGITDKLYHGIDLARRVAKRLNEIDEIDVITGAKHEIWGLTEAECTPAAIRQFPRPLISQKARSHGALIIHTIVAVYMFFGLAIVCDKYFVASLDRICEELNMAPDVAGATFMAVGSSAPEVATVISGIFYAADDIGISGVIGSSVFNIMFVISVCALAAGTVVYLNWWPLIRDSIFYTISILLMLAVIDDKNVTRIESLIMLLVYGVYCIVLHFNPVLERWAQTLPVPFKTKPPKEHSGLVSNKNLEDEQKQYNYSMEWNGEGQPQQHEQQQQQLSHWSPGKPEPPYQEQLSCPALNQATSDVPAAQPQATGSILQDYYKPKEYDPSTTINYLLKPDEAGIWQKIKWGTLYPIHFFCIYTMPDCRSEKYKNWYLFTFFVSILWISFYSYFMVWMITIIGYTFSIPDSVMGFTFVAAGVSVPDALSSIAVIKKGYGDMAVSNAIGSKVFGILVCLGLPWFIKTAMVDPGGHVKIISKGLIYSTFLLLSTVAFLVIAILYNGWKLDRKFGIVLMIWYLLFITFASLYELNVFGQMNPPECTADY